MPWSRRPNCIAKKYVCQQQMFRMEVPKRQATKRYSRTPISNRSQPRPPRNNKQQIKFHEPTLRRRSVQVCPSYISVACTLQVTADNLSPLLSPTNATISDDPFFNLSRENIIQVSNCQYNSRLKIPLI